MGKKVLYINASGESGETVSSADKTSQWFSLSKSTDNIVTDTESPKSAYFSPKKKNYEMTYNIDADMSMDSILKKLNKSLGIIDEPSSTHLANWTKSTSKYNRFKLPSTNDMLTKGFAHVFFVRPNCNILDGNSFNLTSKLVSNQTFNYSYKNSPELVKELALNNGSDHDFMLSISNKVASFSLSDEYIGSDSYGKTYTGYKISYGKNIIESKTAGTLSITYDDDRFFHVYQLHKLWIEYISGVYRGEIEPRDSDVINKILDYAGACYYILTAEDGETILFWSKYYGIFPTTIPSEQFSWAKGNYIKGEQITIPYAFSFKEDFNPAALVEFNRNAHAYDGSLSYVPIYDSNLGHAGETWVGTPFIELVDNNSDTGCSYMFKLRFKKN